MNPTTRSNLANVLDSCLFIQTTCAARTFDDYQKARMFRRAIVCTLFAIMAVASATAMDITAFTESGELTWSAPVDEAVLEYRVEWTSNLTSNAWIDAGVSVAPSTNVLTAQVDMEKNQQFFRVKARVPDYLVVDLSGGECAANFPISYLSDVPDGGWTDEYKTLKMVFRRIPAGTFMMGSPTNELGRQNDETQHLVTLTKDFYIGVFEVTQAQYSQVYSYYSTSCYFTNAADRATRPTEYLTADYQLVGSGTSPMNNNFLARFRSKTGRLFDLPTEAQWEYAARAGTNTALNTGKNLTDTVSCTNLAQAGRYFYNGGSVFTSESDASQGTAKVGSYLPNTWGLYDMHGNVSEWCLDWYGAYSGNATDPKGPSTGEYRVLRGGNIVQFAQNCRVSSRGYKEELSYSITPDGTWIWSYYPSIGFRLALTCP